LFGSAWAGLASFLRFFFSSLLFVSLRLFFSSVHRLSLSLSSRAALLSVFIEIIEFIDQNSFIRLILHPGSARPADNLQITAQQRTHAAVDTIS
jgi:hypothetical protein